MTSGRYRVRFPFPLVKVVRFCFSNHFSRQHTIWGREDGEASFIAGELRPLMLCRGKVLALPDELGDSVTERNPVRMGVDLGEVAGVVGDVDVGSHIEIMHLILNAC